jgi:predicted transcriptional regulator
MNENKNTALIKTSDTRELLLQLVQTRNGTSEELTIARLAKKLGYSSSVISQYLAEDGIKYTGDLTKLEKAVDDFIRNELRRKVSGVETMESAQVQELRKALEYIRKTNDVGIVLAEAGVTKTRAVDYYAASNPLAIFFRARQWARDVASIESVVFEAVKGGWDGQSKRVKHAIKKLTGSDRLIIVDDAHKLGVDVPVVPGIMPITSSTQLLRFSDACGAEIPRWIRLRLQGYGDDAASIKAFGLDVVADLCDQLRNGGVPALHFYTMNQSATTLELLKRLA